MKRSVAKSQLSVGMFFGLALLVGNNVIGCGDSSSDTPETGVATNNPGGAASGSNNNSSNGGGSSTSGTPNTEGNPNNIALDPNRDQSTPINLVASGAVQCGGQGNYCIAPNLTCCASAGGMGMAATFSCAQDAAACPAGTAQTTSCSSQASCGSGQVCCRTGGGGGMGGGAQTTSCAASCATGSVQVCVNDAECGAGNQCNGNGTCGPVACTATSCTGGQICCRAAGGGGGGGGAQPACVAPTGGLCPNNQRQVCATDADCPTGNTCAPLGGGGGGGGNANLVCTPPPCTTTSCATGQVCCVGGQVGNNPTCAAANNGACPNNSRLLCTTDADCAAAAGTLCSPAPNGGMGPLSCRVPPPPVTDAGADAGG